MFGGMGLSVLKYISCPYLYFGFSQLSLDFDVAITFCFAGITFSLDSSSCFSLMLRNTISWSKLYSLFPWNRQQMLQTALSLQDLKLMTGIPSTIWDPLIETEEIMIELPSNAEGGQTHQTQPIDQNGNKCFKLLFLLFLVLSDLLFILMLLIFHLCFEVYS
jgi:hypothetical protein